MMIYYIVVEVTKREPIDLIITKKNQDIIGAHHLIFFTDVVYKSYRVGKQKKMKLIRTTWLTIICQRSTAQSETMRILQS
jgi:hypothetical protein